MYRWLLVAHGDFRWVVILSGAAVIVGAFWSLLQRQLYERRHAALGRVFTIAVDVQVAMGAALYAVFSPLTTVPLSLGVTAPAGSDMHFFAVTHAQIMVAALIAVHMSSLLIRRGSSSVARLRRTVICYALTLGIILSGVPWWRPLLRS